MAESTSAADLPLADPDVQRVELESLREVAEDAASTPTAFEEDGAESGYTQDEADALALQDSAQDTLRRVTELDASAASLVDLGGSLKSAVASYQA